MPVDSANLNMINWAAALRGNRRKGAALLKAMLADPVQRAAICADPDALSLIFGYGSDDPLAEAAREISGDGLICYSNSRYGRSHATLEELARDSGMFSEAVGNDSPFSTMLVLSKETVCEASSIAATMLAVFSDADVADRLMSSEWFADVVKGSEQSVQALASSEAAMGVAATSRVEFLEAILTSKDVSDALLFDPVSVKAVLGSDAAIGAVDSSDAAVSSMVTSELFWDEAVKSRDAMVGIASRRRSMASVLASDIAMSRIVASEDARWACNSVKVSKGDTGAVTTDKVWSFMPEWGDVFDIPGPVGPGAYTVGGGGIHRNYNKVEIRSASTTSSPYNKQELMTNYPAGYETGAGYEIVISDCDNNKIIFIGPGDKVVMHSYNVTVYETWFNMVWEEGSTE